MKLQKLILLFRRGGRIEAKISTAELFPMESCHLLEDVSSSLRSHEIIPLLTYVLSILQIAMYLPRVSFARLTAILISSLLLIPQAMAFNIFEQMFSGGGGGAPQQPQNAPSDSNAYQRNYDGSKAQQITF